ncbi:19139_t:CDS:1, partial [Gigaspora rosea]
VEKDHKKDKAIAIVQDAASPDKCQEIVSKQKEDGSIELDDSVCKELGAPKEDIITTIKKNITNEKLKPPELLSTAVNLSYLKNAAPQHEGEWRDNYDKAREYLSKKIGDKNAEEELLECADKYVVDKITGKVIEEKKRDVIDLKKDELQKIDKPGLMSGIYDTITYVPTKIGEIGSQIFNYGTSKGPEQKEYEERSAPGEEEKSQTEPGKKTKAAFFGVADDKEEPAFFGVPDDQEERRKVLSAIQDAASPEHCKEIVSKQKDDGSIELDDT